LVRYNTNGSLDPTFDGDGIMTTNIGDYSAARAVAIQPDGKIVAAGYGSNSSALVRYNANGSLDPTFDGDGIVTTSIGGAHAVAIQQDGKIVTAGESNSDFAVARYNTDGSLDPTFDGDGIVTTDIDGHGDLARAVAIQPDGKIVAVGNGNNGSNSDFALVRYNTEGSLDPTFDGDGIVATNIDGHDDLARAVAIQPDGKIVAAGSSAGSNNNFASVRYNTNGSLDATFAHGDGIKIFDFNNSDDSASGIALDGQGRAVIVGGADIDPVHPYYYFALGRLWLQGTAAPDNTPFDFDGDGRADISVFRPSEGNWYLERSRDGFAAVNFGLGADKIVPADYDGDGETDIAVYRPSIGYWYVLRSSNGTFFYTHFGTAEDIPAPDDFDNDGRADVTVYNAFAGMWSINCTSWGLITANFGTSEDIPVVGDYDGDGHADLAVFRPSNGTWYYSSDLIDPSHNFVAVQFGLSSDVVTPADYDGDNRTDIAVYRPSTGVWYILNSSNGVVRATQFGLPDDIPTAADYDGDGRADISVFRPSDGIWYRLNSSNGSFFAVPFGTNGDKPTQAAFRY
jgi:uncharacterized delta-60 repeat protein